MLTKNMLSGKDTAFQIAAKKPEKMENRKQTPDAEPEHLPDIFLSIFGDGIRYTVYGIRYTLADFEKNRDNPYMLCKMEKQTPVGFCFYKNLVLYYVLKNINSYVRKKEESGGLSFLRGKKSVYRIPYTVYRRSIL